MARHFAGMDLKGFWEPIEGGDEDEGDGYVGAPLTDEMVAAVERDLGYKLPAAYIELMKVQNGGVPRKTAHRTREVTSWADDHIAICGIYSVGDATSYSLCGDLGSKHWIEEWEYPPIGVYFADCPSAGHDMVCLDYRACGPEGEPQVVHVDQEWDYEIVFVAENFEAFIRGLEDESAFRTGD